MLRQEQQQAVVQRIDPKLIAANAILQRNSQELAQQIERELLENPALDVVEDEPVCTGDCVDPRNCPTCSEALKAAAAPRGPMELLDAELLDTEADFYRESRRDSDEDYDPVGNIEAELTLADHLRSQLRALVSDDDYAVGEYIISSLDDSGWLDNTVEALADEMSVTPERVLSVLRTIQTLDPPGVGARDLRECLLRQLEFLREDGQGNSLAESLVRDHFPAIVSRRYRAAARRLGASADDVKEALGFIRASLNPYPASQFRPPWAYKPSNGGSVVRPDVILRRTEVGYHVDVTMGSSLVLAVNPAWREAYERQQRGGGGQAGEDHSRVVEYVERAEGFIRNLNHRRRTLRLITRAVIDLQQGFLETGSRMFIRPLTRSRVAEIVGLHESTVSRATARKFVQLPSQEVVPFEVFFNASLAVKSAIEEIVSHENRSKPLSDREIVQKLRERGFDVARRTVVKYREARKLLSSSSRRRP